MNIRKQIKEAVYRELLTESKTNSVLSEIAKEVKKFIYDNGDYKNGERVKFKPQDVFEIGSYHVAINQVKQDVSVSDPRMFRLKITETVFGTLISDKWYSLYVLNGLLDHFEKADFYYINK